MSPFLTNLLMFSPLLALAALILYILDRADTLRQGSGLLPPEPIEPVGSPLIEETPNEDEEKDDSLASEGDEEPDLELDPQFDPQFEAGEEAPAQPIEDNNALPIPHPQPGAIEPPTVNPRTRNVGAKKARSLARRDQRRAYHEFLHSQQSERARAAALVADEEEERIFEEKRRRALAEEEISLKREKERLARLEAERKVEEERKRDVEKLRDVVKAHKGGKKSWRIEELANGVGREEAWVRNVLKVEGLVGWRDGVWRMITGEGWYVVVGEKELSMLYGKLEERGKMEWGEMAKFLEEAVA